MDFELNKRLRRQIKHSMGFASKKFRKWLVISVVFVIVASPAAFAFAAGAARGIRGAHEDFSMLFGVTAVAVVVVVGFIFAAGAWRATTYAVTGVLNERLVFGGGQLMYTYHDRDGDVTPFGFCAVVVDMASAVWHVDPVGRRVIFDVGARYHWYQGGLAEGEPLLPYSQMEERPGFPLGLYWEPDLAAALPSLQAQARQMRGAPNPFMQSQQAQGSRM